MNDILKKGVENTEQEILEVLENRGGNWISEIAIFSFVRNNKYFRAALGNLIMSNKIETTNIELPNLNSIHTRTISAKMYRKAFTI